MSDVEKQYEGADPRAPHSTRSDEIETQLGELDQMFEAKLVRKLDVFIIPVVMLLYLLSFLDRYVSNKQQTSPALQYGVGAQPASNPTRFTSSSTTEHCLLITNQS